MIPRGIAVVSPHQMLWLFESSMAIPLLNS